MHFLISILKILLSTIIEKQIFCYQFPKQKKIYYYIFRRLIPFSGIRRLFYYHKGGFYYYDRYRKSTVAGPAPIGRSPGTEPSERAKGKNTQAHSDRGNSGKGAAGGADDRAASIGGISITKNTQKRIKCSEGLRETGCRFLFPKGALTHHLSAGQAVVSLPLVGHARSPRGIALSAESDRRCHSTCKCRCHRLRSRPYRTESAIWPAACDKPATGSFVAEMDSAPALSIFSFTKEKQKKETR